MQISAKFKPQDLWVGAYWERGREFVNDGPVYRFVRVWICVVPMLPIKIEWRRVIDAAGQPAAGQGGV